MNENYILTTDNVFTKKECNNLINSFKEKTVKGNDNWNYNFYDIDVENFIYLNKLNEIIDLYIKKYPEVNMTSSYWKLVNLRYKVFEKNKGFTNWHSEHSFNYPYRILSLQIYLSNHNCGTEFFSNKKTILSKVGRVSIFPAYFTHTHKGQICMENKKRHIITGYISFYKKGPNNE